MNAWGTCHQVREKNDMNLLYFFPICLQVKKNLGYRVWRSTVTVSALAGLS